MSRPCVSLHGLPVKNSQLQGDGDREMGRRGEGERQKEGKRNRGRYEKRKIGRVCEMGE